MAWLRNLVYLALLAVVAPYLVWRGMRTGRYRRGWNHKLLGRIPSPPSGLSKDTTRIWLHAVSLGEVNLLIPLVAQLQCQLPEAEILITTTTDTGYDQAQKKFPAHTVVFLPLDFTWAVGTAMRRWQPDLLVLSELEIWPNFIAAAKRYETKIAVVNARLSDKSFRGYARLRFWLQKSFQSLDLVAAQTNDYAQRFAAMGTLSKNIAVTGNMKFDVAQRADQKQVAEIKSRLGFDNPQKSFQDRLLLVAGSTQQEDEVVALSAFKELSQEFPNLSLVVVPRHPERATAVARLVSESGFKSRLMSQDNSPLNSGEVLILDLIGQLVAWWELADIAFVGGSFGSRGGQNMLEPACCGKPVCFGPRTGNFRDVVQLLLAASAAFVVRSPQELADFIRGILLDPDAKADMGQRAAAVVEEHRGAVPRVAKLLVNLIQDRAIQMESKHSSKPKSYSDAA
jgi:3-deoxy-D-manno-octulosonic-acid transferase